MTDFLRQAQLSRRELLALMAAAGGAMLVPEWLIAGDLDPRVSHIVSSTITVDLHSHVPITYIREGQPPAPDVAGPSSDSNFAAEMHRAGLSALCYTYAVDHAANTRPGEYYKLHMQALDEEDRLFAQHKVSRALNLKDLQGAHKKGEPAMILTCEGAQFLEGKLNRVEEAYRHGLRVMQIVHHDHDKVAPLGDIQSPANEFGGLTPFGAEVVRECNRLHIVLDLAHAAFSTVKGVLKATTQPITITHTALDTPLGRAGQSESMLQRLVTREHAKAVADAGGIIGVWKSFKTLENLVTGIKEMADVVDVDHLGIGTDTFVSQPASMARRRELVNDVWPDHPGGFVYKVANEMLRQGFTPAETSKVIGGNFCRYFGKLTAG
ncbi:MAG TPA: membrane dipeptidase [Terriglobales bacterium]|nr:membrane dipeptidase [Terriglobales bacterium]